MKTLIITLTLLCTFSMQGQAVLSKNGHPEHFIAGTVISAGISYFIFTKTDNKVKSWIIAAISTTVIGYVKEVVDPKWFGGVRSTKDFVYTALGSVLGASIVIPLNKRSKSAKTASFARVF